MAEPPIDDGADALLIEMLSAGLASGFNLDIELARIMAKPLSENIRKQGGGRSVYIPAQDLTSRNQAIKASWTGSNVSVLADQWGLTERRIRQILCD